MFRRLRDSSLVTYSSHLHCLIFNTLRFYCCPGWSSSYRYPDLDPSQIKALKELYQSLEDQSSNTHIDTLFHNVCYALFAHQKSQYEVSRGLTNFFSPVICFLVLHCVTERGSTPNSSGISNSVAPIMYAIRTCIFRKMLQRRDAEGISLHEYVFYPKNNN